MFADQVRDFSANLNNLRDFVETVSSFLDTKVNNEVEENISSIAPFILAIYNLSANSSSVDNQVIEAIKERIGEKIDLSLLDSPSQNMTLDEIVKRHEDGFFKTIEILKTYSSRKVALYSNALISLVSHVEWFVAQLIHKYYERYPEAMETTDKQFCLKDLKRFETIEDAQNYLVEKKVESILRGNIEDWLSFFKSKIKLSMSYLGQREKNQLIEAVQRRNLLVHNGGVVNRIYLTKYPKELEEKPEVGSRIIVSSDYLDNMISVFEKSFLLIAAELWKKIDPDNQERGKLLIELAYNSLVYERYDTAESLSLFLTRDKSLSEEERLYGKINYWIAKKYSGRFDEVEEEIQKEDFSAKSRLFILAKNILLDNFEEAMKDIEYFLEHKEDKKGIPPEALKEWPLFREFRKQPFYDEVLAKYSS